MTRTREVLKRQTHPGWVILWIALAGLGLCSDIATEPPVIALEEMP